MVVRGQKVEASTALRPSRYLSARATSPATMMEVFRLLSRSDFSMTTCLTWVRRGLARVARCSSTDQFCGTVRQARSSRPARPRRADTFSGARGIFKIYQVFQVGCADYATPAGHSREQGPIAGHASALRQAAQQPCLAKLTVTCASAGEAIPYHSTRPGAA